MEAEVVFLHLALKSRRASSWGSEFVAMVTRMIFHTSLKLQLAPILLVLAFNPVFLATTQAL